jgi:hypothetical protein
MLLAMPRVVLGIETLCPVRSRVLREILETSKGSYRHVNIQGMGDHIVWFEHGYAGKIGVAGGVERPTDLATTAAGVDPGGGRKDHRGSEAWS